MKDLILRILREEVKNGKVTCDNCGWSWKLSEGGHDPYICHQCNHNNEPKNINEVRYYGYLSEKDVENFYPIVKKIFDNFGVNQQSLDDINNHIFRGKNSTFKFLEKYFGGKDNFLEEVRKKIQSKNFFCRDCNQYDFTFKVSNVEFAALQGYVEVDVMVSDTGSGRAYNVEDGQYENIRFSQMEEIEGSDFYHEIQSEVISEVEGFLEEELKDFGLNVDVESLDYYPRGHFKN